MHVTSHTPAFVFSGFRLDPDRRLLLRGDEPVALHPKAFELLLTLIENRDRVLSKSELLDTIWEGQFVEENNLAVQISALRKIFGERSNEHRFIVTVPGRGYRFVSDVSFDTEKNGMAEAFHSVVDHATRITNGRAVSSGNGKADSEVEPTPLPIIRYAIALTMIVFGGAFFYWLAGNKPSAAEPKMTRMTANGRVMNAAISADEKFIVFSQKDTEGESLWLRQIETGSQTRIVPPKALEYVGLSISPDNNFIYFSPFGDNRAATMLQRIPLLGGAPQNVGSLDTGVSVSFSPDGSQFAFTQASSSLRESYLMIANADGSDPRTLIRATEAERVIEDHQAGPVSWCPDGSEIAVAVREPSGDQKLDGIVLVDPSTGRERALVKPQFARIQSLGWQSPDVVAFTASERNASESQVWAVNRRTGGVRRITNDVQNYVWLSASRHGRLLTIQKSELSAIHLAGFDMHAGTIEPRELLHEPDINTVTFGGDSSILYTSRTGGTREIWRARPDGTNPEQLTAGANVIKAFSVSPRDGALVFCSARDGEVSLWIADADGKNFRRLTDGEDYFSQFTPDGTSIIFQRGAHDFPTIWRVAVDGQSPPVQLTKIHSIYPVISPDGSRVAFYFMDAKTDGQWRVGLVSSETGELLGKIDLPGQAAQRRMQWHPGGSYLGQVYSTGENASLVLIPVNGGQQTLVSNLGKGIVNSFAWSADGSKLVYLLTTETADAISLTNF